MMPAVWRMLLPEVVGMELVPEGPDAEALRAHMQDVMKRHRAEVDRRSPVYGLARPDLAPRVLGASDSVSVTLHAGELLSADGPMVSVRTARLRSNAASSGSRRWLLEPGVPDQLAEEHARLSEHAGIIEAVEDDTAPGEGQLRFADGVVPAEVHRESRLWAARAVVVADPQSSVVVTVVSRGVPLEQVRLAVVELEPYWQGRDSYIAALSPRQSVVHPQDLDLPPSRGLDAHRALVEFCLAASAQALERLRVGQRPRPVPGAGPERQRLWEGAVRAQMHLADQGRAEANEHVAQIVNQLTSLARTSWFLTAELRTAAIGQVLGYQVFDADVPTREAQQLWQRVWERRRARPAPGSAPLPPDDREDRHRLLEADRELERRAQQAWDTWAEQAT